MNAFSAAIFALTLFGQISLSASLTNHHTTKNLYRSSDNRYPYNPYVPLEIWDTMAPYFLPESHPSKILLDAMFSSSRVTYSQLSLMQAGFSHIKYRSSHNAFVIRHSDIPGLYLKVYTDQQPITDDWARFKRRLDGSDVIRACILRHGYQDMFDVPLKWVYPLPLEPSPPNDPLCIRKNFVLIAQDMNLLSFDANRMAYRSRITKEHLDALYIILTEAGLKDSIYISNIPFNKEGKICFVDTEHFHKWPIALQTLQGWFSPKMGAYWEELIRNGGPR